jgi:amino acid transporter
MIYYVGAVVVLGLNLSADDPILKLNLETGATSSPFALMFDRAGIPVLRNLINACALIASVSTANADLYIGVRPRSFPHLTIVEPHPLCSSAGRSSSEDV